MLCTKILSLPAKGGFLGGEDILAGLHNIKGLFEGLGFKLEVRIGFRFGIGSGLRGYL